MLSGSYAFIKSKMTARSSYSNLLKLGLLLMETVQASETIEFPFKVKGTHYLLRYLADEQLDECIKSKVNNCEPISADNSTCSKYERDWHSSTTSLNRCATDEQVQPFGVCAVNQVRACESDYASEQQKVILIYVGIAAAMLCIGYCVGQMVYDRWGPSKLTARRSPAKQEAAQGLVKEDAPLTEKAQEPVEANAVVLRVVNCELDEASTSSSENRASFGR